MGAVRLENGQIAIHTPAPSIMRARGFRTMERIIRLMRVSVSLRVAAERPASGTEAVSRESSVCKQKTTVTVNKDHSMRRPQGEFAKIIVCKDHSMQNPKRD